MQLFNSLTRYKEEFVPLVPGHIKMYICGQTVYDYCHLGHARKAIVFDMIRRWFIASGYQVTFVENITDIDDKIIKRAQENNETITMLTERFISYMHEDFDHLGIMRPDLQPRATEYIPHILAIITNLVNQGYAYPADNGDVYYAVNQFATYGKLSGKKLSELNAGERVEIDVNKRNPLDFVLWKNAKAREPAWDSPFGKGRPGWHIECSAMAEALLGKHFDIHGGGQDLQFPHHENEIAQSEAHNGCKFANYWLHNGFLNINAEKMSKSLGNFFTLRDVLKEYDAEVLRFCMLKTHYRSPLNFSYTVLSEAKAGLTRLYTTVKAFADDIHSTVSETSCLANCDWDKPYAKRFKAAMDDDFNTPLAISVLFELCSEINLTSDSELASMLRQLAGMIGLLNRSASEFLQAGIRSNPTTSSAISVTKIDELIAKRNKARHDKDFTLADSIRDELLRFNIILEDRAGTTSWRKV